MSTGQRAVMLCGWGVKAGMARVWWQVNCVNSCITCVISERFKNSSHRRHGQDNFISFIMFKIYNDKRTNERTIKSMNTKWKKPIKRDDGDLTMGQLMMLVTVKHINTVLSCLVGSGNRIRDWTKTVSKFGDKKFRNCFVHSRILFTLPTRQDKTV